MEVIGHDLGASPRRLDGGGVDLEEFLRVVGAVVLLGQVGSELGGTIDPPQVRGESSAPLVEIVASVTNTIHHCRSQICYKESSVMNLRQISFH